MDIYIFSMYLSVASCEKVRLQWEKSDSVCVDTELAQAKILNDLIKLLMMRLCLFV